MLDKREYDKLYDILERVDSNTIPMWCLFYGRSLFHRNTRSDSDVNSAPIVEELESHSADWSTGPCYEELSDTLWVNESPMRLFDVIIAF